MSAVDEAAGVGSGKSTQDSSRLSVGEATWALTLPQLPYADAVHALLLDVDVLAAPELLGDAARHFAQHRLDGREWVVPFVARWSEAVYLDIALAHYEDREQPLW